VLSFINLGSFVNKTKLASMKAQLNKETASGATNFQKVQYGIQKNWLSQKLGHVEFILNPSKLPSCMFVHFVSSGSYFTCLGYFGAGVPKANTSYITMSIALQHPFSRGSVVGVVVVLQQ
jgi:hypothetical protein